MNRVSLFCPALLALLCTLSLSTSAWAQDDMTFGEDEGTSTEDGGMTFEEGGEEEEEADPEAVSDSDKGRVMSVLALPSGALDSEQLGKLQAAMMKASQLATQYDGTSGTGLIAPLEENNLDDCVRNQLCLGGVGTDAKSDYILMGRTTKIGEKYTFTMDLFDVREKLFIKSKTYEDLDDFDDVLDVVVPGARSVFDIRERVKGPQVGVDVERSTIQTVFAVTSGVLSLACIGGGVYYGLQAADEEQAIKDMPKNADGRYEDLTQAQARQMLQDAGSTATSANIFYGLGIALGAASAALFFIDFGSDVDASDSATISDVMVAPSVSADSVGVGTMFRF